MKEFLLSIDEHLLVNSFKTVELEDTFEDNLYNTIINLPISKLYEVGIISNEEFFEIKEQFANISESFSEFAAKIKDKLANVKDAIRNQIEKIIANIKTFIAKLVELFIDFLNYCWDQTKGHVNTYVNNLFGAVKGSKELKNKGFKEEAVWYKDTMIWFEKDFNFFLGNLLNGTLKTGLKESIQNDPDFLEGFLNDADWLNETELEFTADDDQKIFLKFHNETAASSGYKTFQKVANLLIQIVDKLKNAIAGKVEEKLYWFALKFENWPGAPKAPNDFDATGFIAATATTMGVAVTTGIDVNILNWKNARIAFMKHFLQIILVGIVPGTDIIFFILYLKMYFVVLGLTIQKLVKEA